MKLRTLIFLGGLFGGMNVIKGQAFYGTTGLLHAPTAVMQKDKTVMLGGNMLDVNILSRYWVRSEYHSYTYNYYINCTLFPWLEVAYTCTLVKGIHGSSYWPQQTWGRFTNQDRSFHFRLRAWKEGWWKAWTPQVVIGANDPGSHSSNGGGDIDWGGGGSGNHNYLTRYYLAATKHVEFSGIGTVGVHVAWAEVCPGHAEDLHTATYTVNVGGTYSIWKDHINLIAELNDGKYFIGGIFFKLHLK